MTLSFPIVSASRFSPGFFALVVAAVTACNDSGRANPIMDAFAQRPPPATVATDLAFRFPDRARQPVRLFNLPDFEELSWRFDDRDLSAALIAGYSSAEDMVFFRPSNGWLRSLELSSGRVHTLDTAAALTTVGPTSTIFVVRSDSTVARVADRRMELWPDTLPGMPERVWGTTGNRIVALFRTEDGPYLTTVAEEWDRERIEIHDGQLAVTEWGDYVAIVADNVITGIRLREPNLRPTLAFEGSMTSMVFSASGHRLYYITDRTRLHAINRFDFTSVLDTGLAGQFAEIHADASGRYLLARTAEGDSLVLLNPSDGTRLMARATIWGGGLPTTTAAGNVLVRDSLGVINVDPLTGNETGRIDGTSGQWIVIPWDPNRPTLQLVAETASAEAQETGDRIFYAQLGSTSNLAWASDRQQGLTAAGLPARVVMPSEFDDRYRLVLGPYPSRVEAEDNARRLGQAYFIISFDRADTTIAFR